MSMMRREDFYVQYEILVPTVDCSRRLHQTRTARARHVTWKGARWKTRRFEAQMEMSKYEEIPRYHYVLRGLLDICYF